VSDKYILWRELGSNINPQVVWSGHSSDEVEWGSVEHSHKTICTANKDVLVAGRNCVRTVCLLSK